MNPNANDHWRSQGGPSASDNQQAGRPYGSFGASNGTTQQSHVLPPPPAAGFGHQHNQSQPSHAGDRLSIADLTASAPAQSQYNTAPPPAHSQAHQMNALPAGLAQQSPSYLDREREIRDLRAREEMRERERQEREARERHLERLSREQQQAPLQSHAGSIPLHQPVASKVQGSLQGPNGLLGGAHSANTIGQLPQPYVQHQLQAQAPGQPYLTQPSPASAHQQIANGQQPILNDALSYLDQVKVRFSDQPDVYNRFLDIMKDFKSQAIDTPGVISRVSELFNGHPALIQGFNTFLPPGYRIECGTADNPDAIRVTTPSGTISHSLRNTSRDGFDLMSGLSRQDTMESSRGWGQQISPNVRAARLPGFEPDSEAMQQEQRNVSQLQNAATAAANGHTRLVGSSPPPGQFAAGGLFAGGADAKRGGPVEFNHAISYVNKIKNRFAQQPEIYKQFLEILQTYQRESKPIQDVYAQVTQLFLSAPDLLEDFKQFLPESAAHAKAQAAARAQQEAEMSNIRGDPSYAGSLPQTQTPRPNPKMPPMGQFDPPSTSKDNKKRKAPGITAPLQANASDARMRGTDVQPSSKKQKLDNKPKPTELPLAQPVDPTLVPALPEPLPPSSTASTSQEELSFFERAKKQIGNRSSYAEFLKLINLYSQDIIDKYVLSDRIQSFIGSNPDLMAYFKGMLGIDEQDEIVEARMRPDSGRVNLAHCRAYGPSYRHLPKRDQNKTCKGRDGMCYEVLNDVWASHPTWASEDSGFVAHRKNQYEEALHRIEEERHDYDFHIESCMRTIQLMEPLVQQINVMNDEGKANFRVDRNFGGASEAIPKRVILKIYGREVGNQVMTDLFARPAQVMPVVLNRLKQKLEEWKQVQREWEKVWRDQIHKQFWKSLDHQGIAQKNADKRNFQQKTLTSEIQAKYEEQKKARDGGKITKTHQLEFHFEKEDRAVLIHTTQLILVALHSEKMEINDPLRKQIKDWLQDFVVKFFDFNYQDFVGQVQPAVDKIVNHTDGLDDENADLQQSAADRSKFLKGDFAKDRRIAALNGKEDSMPPTSRESTPAPEAMSTTSTDQESEQRGEPAQPKKWIRINKTKEFDDVQELAMDDTYPHQVYNFYANANLYCFFRLFEMLYARLLSVKKEEAAVIEAVRRDRGDGMPEKPAISLHMMEKLHEKYFKDATGSYPFYDQIVEFCGEVLLGRRLRDDLEDTLRRYYNKTGWQLYTIDRLVHAAVRFLSSILAADGKEKSLEIANLFFKDREREETTRKIELQYRKQVEKMSKDGEVFRISWNPQAELCTVRLFPLNDTTFDSNDLNEEARWQTYVASLTMTDPTEGVAKGRDSYMKRNVPRQTTNPQIAYEENVASLNYVDDQMAYIAPENYKIFLNGDYAFERRKPRRGRTYNVREDGQPAPAESDSFKLKFVRNPAWMKDQPIDAVRARLSAWETALENGLSGFEDQFKEQ